MRIFDKNALPVLVIAACAGLAVALMVWALVQTYEPTKRDALKSVRQTTGRVSNEPPVPAPPAPKNDTAWDSHREIPQNKSR